MTPADAIELRDLAERERLIEAERHRLARDLEAIRARRAEIRAAHSEDQIGAADE